MTDFPRLREVLDAFSAVMERPYPEEPIEVGFTKKDGGDPTFVWTGLPNHVVRGVVRDDGAGLAIVNLTVTAKPGPRAKIGSEAIRSIPTAHLLNVVLARIAFLSAEDVARRTFGQKRRPEAQRALARTVEHSSTQGRGRPKLSPAFLRDIARLHVNEMENGAKGVHERLARRLNESEGWAVKEATVRNWVYEARHHDPPYLMPTKQGRSGAQLAPAAMGEDE